MASSYSEMENIAGEISKIEAELTTLKQERDRISESFRFSTPKITHGRVSDSGVASAQQDGQPEDPSEIPDLAFPSYLNVDRGEHPRTPEETSSTPFDIGVRPRVRFSDTDHGISDSNEPVPTAAGGSGMPHVTARRPNRRYLPSSPLVNPDGNGAQMREPNRRDRQGVRVKPATYDGTGSWKDFKSHFDTCARINQWSTDEKGMYLAVSLRGQAQGVLDDLPDDTGQHYSTLVAALEERFAPPSQTGLYRVQLRERRQKAVETLPEMGQAIRRLAGLAYPTAPREVQETLAREQFIDTLFDAGIHIRIQQSRPTSLNDAIRLVVELEAFDKAEQRRKEGQGYLQAASTAETSPAAPAVANEEMVNAMNAMQSKLDDLKKRTRAVVKQVAPVPLQEHHRLSD